MAHVFNKNGTVFECNLVYFPQVSSLLGFRFDQSFLLQLLVVSARKPVAELLSLEELVVGDLGFVFPGAAGPRGPSSDSGPR